jgi:hypothetical protein
LINEGPGKLGPFSHVDNKLSTKNTEQSSGSNAEELLPTFPTHVDHSSRLKAIDDGSSYPNSMCFYSPDGSVFVGIIIEELADSFLVGVAATLRMNSDRQVTSEEVSTQPMIRLMKAHIKYLVVPTPMTVYHYFAFLEENGYNKLPEYFTAERKALIANVRADSKYHTPFNLTANETTATDSPGDSEYSFIPHKQSESIH